MTKPRNGTAHILSPKAIPVEAYTITPCRPPWPRGEARVHGREPIVVRPEPWPDVLTRPWPDGVKGLPWLPWLMGHKRRTSQSRFVARAADGRPVIFLHERLPILRQTVGIFNGDDVRIGYCGGGFKGGAGITVWDTTHQVVGTLKENGSPFRLVGEELPGEITRTQDGYSVTAIRARPNDGLFLLAATLVLIMWRKP